MTEEFKPKITHTLRKVFIHEKYASMFEDLEIQGATKIIRSEEHTSELQSH